SISASRRTSSRSRAPGTAITATGSARARKTCASSWSRTRKRRPTSRRSCAPSCCRRRAPPTHRSKRRRVPRSSRPDRKRGAPSDPAADATRDGTDHFADNPADPADPADAADLADCERRAVGLLARREHSRLELERKLASRGYGRGLITETLDGLEQSGLLD